MELALELRNLRLEAAQAAQLRLAWGLGEVTRLGEHLERTAAGREVSDVNVLAPADGLLRVIVLVLWSDDIRTAYLTRGALTTGSSVVS